MDEADAIALGAEFGQEAIFVLTSADRRVVGCADKRIAATGWSSELNADMLRLGPRPPVVVTLLPRSHDARQSAIWPNGRPLTRRAHASH